MNAQMRLVIMLTSVAVSGSILFAAEPAPPAQKAPAPASSEPSATTAGKAADATKAAEEKKAAADKKAAEEKSAAAEKKAPAEPAADQDPQPKRAVTAADKAGSPQRFNPSEQVRADFDVSFPIDI